MLLQCLSRLQLLCILRQTWEDQLFSCLPREPCMLPQATYVSRLYPPHIIPEPQQKLNIVRKQGCGELPRLQMLNLINIDVRYAVLDHAPRGTQMLLTAYMLQYLPSAHLPGCRRTTLQILPILMTEFVQGTSLHCKCCRAGHDVLLCLSLKSGAAVILHT